MFLYWFLFPLIFGATLAGLGLGLRRLSVPFSSALLLPAGYVVAVLISTACCWWSGTTWLAAPLLVILAIAGWATSFRDLKFVPSVRREWPWLAAGFAGFLAFGASVLSSGKPTFTGYNEIVDIAYQFDWADYLGHHGRTWVEKGISGPLTVVSRTLEVGYPSGPQSILGTFPKMLGLHLEWAYTPMMATMAACLVLAAYTLLREVTESRRFAALGAFAAGQASVLIAYAQIGGIKELAASTALLTTAAFIPAARGAADRSNWRSALPFAVGIAGSFSIFGLTLAPWLLLLGLGTLIVVWRTVSLRTALRRGGFAFGGAVFFSLPTIVPALSSLHYARMMESPDEVGNLAAPISRWAATGVWIANEHRVPLTGDYRTASIIIASLVIVFALVGLVNALYKGAYGIAVITVASLTGMTFLIVKMGPWVELKGIVITSPVILVLAAIGLSTMVGKKYLRRVAWYGIALLVGTGLAGDIRRYGDTQLAPYERLSSVGKLGDKWAGVKNTLIPDADEHLEYQLRKANGVGPYNTTFVPTQAWAADPSKPTFQYIWDLDQLDPSYVGTFEQIVTRHSPGQSRPPRQFDLVDQGRYYDVWRRGASPAPTAHLSLTGAADPEEMKKCQAFVDAVPAGGSVTIAPAPENRSAGFDPAKLGPGITAQADGSGIYLGPKAAGAQALVDIGDAPGAYDVYAVDTSNRKLTLTVAGQLLKFKRDRTLAFHPDYLGTITVPGGLQAVTLEGGTTSLSSGTNTTRNYGNYAGSVTLVPSGTLHPPLRTGLASTMKCGDRTDWVETP